MAATKPQIQNDHDPSDAPLKLRGVVAIEPRVGSNIVEITYGLNRPADVFEVVAAMQLGDLHVVEGQASISAETSPGRARAFTEAAIKAVREIAVTASNLRSQHSTARQSVEDALTNIPFD